MEGCIFCKIVKGEIPASKVYEDDKVLAFLDINPVNHGHVLVIPKEHHAIMEETPDEALADVFIQSKHLMKSIKKALKADYVALSVMGTEVPHFHVHLIPRRHDDGLAGFWPRGKYKETEEMKKVAEKVRSAL